MEEQNKYYKPTIEEIHVGWEGEACFVSGGGWVRIDFSKEGEDSFVIHEPKDKEAAKCWSKYCIEEQGKGWEDNIERSYETAVIILKDNRLRGKYLDQSDIESLGWEHTEEKTNEYGITQIEGRVDKKYPGIILAEPMGVFWNIVVAPVQKNNVTPKIVITKTEWGGFTGAVRTDDIYNGTCPSINELRKIMQLVGILEQ